jgi:hypothetical protein
MQEANATAKKTLEVLLGKVEQREVTLNIAKRTTPLDGLLVWIGPPSKPASRSYSVAHEPSRFD